MTAQSLTSMSAPNEKSSVTISSEDDRSIASQTSTQATSTKFNSSVSHAHRKSE